MADKVSVPVHTLGKDAQRQIREKIVQEDARKCVSTKPAKRSKFGNTRAPFESIQGFKLIAASMREARDYATLDIGIQAGLVIRWVPQVSFLLQGGSRYRCDAMVWWADGRVTVRDTKGVETPEFKLKRGLMLSTYNLEIEIVK